MVYNSDGAITINVFACLLVFFTITDILGVHLWWRGKKQMGGLDGDYMVNYDTGEIFWKSNMHYINNIVD